MASNYPISGSSVWQRALPKGVDHLASQAAQPRTKLTSFKTQYFVYFTVFLAAYCIAGKLGQATTNIRSSNLGPVWPAYGVALAAFLLCGNRIWPAIASGAFLIAYFSPVTPLTALGQAAGATIAALSGAFLLRRVAGFDNSLSRLHDAVALVLLGGLGSALVSATIGISVLYATHVHAYTGLGSAWLIYWLGDATGVLLVTPIVLTFPGFLRMEVRGRITELALLFVLLTTACFLIFGDLSLIPVRLHVLAFAVLPFAMWAAIRFGVTGAGLSILLIATFATIETALGSGPFATNTTFTNAVLLDAFFAVLSVTGLTLASAIAERQQAERMREQSVREQGALEARLASQQVVRASEERLRLAQQAARIGTFERDVQTGCVTWAEGLEPLYGLSRGSLEGKSVAFFKELIHPADFERALHVIEKALHTGQPSDCEWRAIWPDGSVHWIASRWRVLMDDSGQPQRVFGVNMDVTERKEAEEALHAREELLKTFVKNVPAAVAMLDREMHYLQVSDRWCADYLSGRPQILGRSHYETFPDMPERWKEVHRRALEGETLRAEEDFWNGRDGCHWARWEVRPWKTPEGTVGGILILSEDITRRKEMEQALSDLSRKLIQSQEQERARIGRELHDDINQRLAMLGAELQRLEDHPSPIKERLQELREQTAEISNDVQALSHELHASKLEYLGVVAGMKSWCREFGERQGIEIDCKTDVASRIPAEIGLTLFRISQEALHNAVKHSAVKRVEVQLSEHSNEILLTISDAGKGFEIEAARQSGGLGLASMEERARLVNGTIAIESKPMGGTTIRVRVPMESGHQSQVEAV